MGEFKAHLDKHGPKLGEMLASGPAGLQRRVEAARALERARIEAERLGANPAATPADVAEAGVRVIEAAIDKVEETPGEEEARSPEAREGAGVAAPPSAARRGRPRKDGPVSRSTAWRRKRERA